MEEQRRLLASELADDYAGLEQFIADAAAGKKPTPRRVVAKAGASAAEVLRSVLSVNLLRVIDLLREWDEDGNHRVSRREFRRALPMLGLAVERADVDALFAQMDIDASGELDLSELQRSLRGTGTGTGGLLPAASLPGGAGAIQTFESMRTDAARARAEAQEDERRGHGRASRVLGRALDENFGRRCARGDATGTPLAAWAVCRPIPRVG